MHPSTHQCDSLGLRQAAARSACGAGDSAPIPAESPVRPVVCIDLDRIAEKTGIGKRKAHELTCEDAFPKPLRLGGRCLRWIESEVDDFLRLSMPRATARSEPGHLAQCRVTRVRDGKKVAT